MITGWNMSNILVRAIFMGVATSKPLIDQRSIGVLPKLLGWDVRVVFLGILEAKVNLIIAVDTISISRHSPWGLIFANETFIDKGRDTDPRCSKVRWRMHYQQFDKPTLIDSLPRPTT
jgi:hypothetical protein